MSQAAPLLPVTGAITVTASNRAQQRGAHGAFRYFGKLAPDVTGAVLDAASELTTVNGPVVDLMAGSGTTLLEAAERGWTAVGVDVNPVALLYSRVKTTPLDRARYRRMLEQTLHAPAASPAEVEQTFAATRNAERWFSDGARQEVATLRTAIARLEASAEADALLAALLGQLRRISNASARTGRIFYDPESAEPARKQFEGAASELVELTPSRPLGVRVQHGDARRSGLGDSVADITFCHPPYFALYRYSADVLRFELEIGGFSRASVNRGEVREGWKSGDPANLEGYVEDMQAVFAEARRITRPTGVFALVASNSTLGDQQLPVIDRLAEALGRSGWSIVEHLVRTAHFGSATYHRSARHDKVIQQDHVLLCGASKRLQDFS